MKMKKSQTSIVHSSDHDVQFDHFPIEIKWKIIHDERDDITYECDDDITYEDNIRDLTRWIIVSKSYQSLVYQSITCINDVDITFDITPFTRMKKIDYPNWGRENEIPISICLSYFTKVSHSLTHLRLDIKGCLNITDEILTKLTNLTFLGLYSYDMITNKGFQALTQLKVLDISSLNTSHMKGRITDDGIYYLTNLTALYINTSGPMYGYGMRHLTQLRILICRCDHINNVFFDPDVAFPFLTNLECLELSSNDYIEGHSLSLLPKLKSLRLFDENRLNDDDFGYLSDKITLLTIEDCFTDVITGNGIKRLTNLTALSICGSSSEIMNDESLKDMTSLKILQCDDDSITDKSIGCLTNLTHLDIMTPFITMDSLTRLTNLKTYTMKLQRHIDYQFNENDLRYLTQLNVNSKDYIDPFEDYSALDFPSLYNPELFKSINM